MFTIIITTLTTLFNEMAHEKVLGRACVFGTGLTHLFSTSLTNNSIIATLCIESRHSLKL